MMEFTNLLDKHGWKFEADFVAAKANGIIRVEDDTVWVEGSYKFEEERFPDTEETPFNWFASEGKPDQIKELGFKNFRLLEPGELTVSKEEAERHNVNPDKTFSEYDQETIRLFTEAARLLNCKLPDRSPLSKREKVATQLLAGMQSNPHVFEEWTFEQQTTKAIELTDLLLKKLGE